MSNSKNKNPNNSNSAENQKIQELQIQSNFYKSLVQELFIHSLKIIEDYQKVLEQMKISNSLSRELKNLNRYIGGIYFSDISNKKHTIKLIRNRFKEFNKIYSKKLHLYKDNNKTNKV